MQKKYWYLYLSNAILKMLIFILIIYHIRDNNFLWAFFTSIMLLLTFIPGILRRYVPIDFPLLLDFFIALSFLFHIGNGLLHESSIIAIYNKFTHFFSAIVVAFLALIVLYVIHEYEGDIVNNKKKVLFDIVIITIALGVLWEFMEWSTDALFGLGSQVDLDDTMFDLLADTLGGICMSLIGFGLIKRDVLEKMGKNIKYQIDQRFTSE